MIRSYQRKFWTDWRKREVAPAIDPMIWQYVKGKPKDSFQHSGEVTYRWQGPDEEER